MLHLIDNNDYWAKILSKINKLRALNSLNLSISKFYAYYEHIQNLNFYKTLPISYDTKALSKEVIANDIGEFSESLKPI